MGANVHNSLYEQALDELEQIIDADPDFEHQEDQDFVQEISDSSLGGFTTKQVNTIKRLYRKYVTQEQEEHDDDDDEQDTEV
jgi:predicted lipid-binding transport protein (Tim44 family)